MASEPSVTIGQMDEQTLRSHTADRIDGDPVRVAEALARTGRVYERMEWTERALTGRPLRRSRQSPVVGRRAPASDRTLRVIDDNQRVAEVRGRTRRVFEQMDWTERALTGRPLIHITTGHSVHFND